MKQRNSVALLLFKNYVLLNKAGKLWIECNWNLQTVNLSGRDTKFQADKT